MKQPMTPTRRSQYSLRSRGSVCHQAMVDTPKTFTLTISSSSMSSGHVADVLQSHPSSLCPGLCLLPFGAVMLRPLDERPRRRDARSPNLPPRCSGSGSLPRAATPRIPVPSPGSGVPCPRRAPLTGYCWRSRVTRILTLWIPTRYQRVMVTSDTSPAVSYKGRFFEKVT